MKEMGVSLHKGKYSGHLNLFRLHIKRQLAVVVFGVRRVCFTIHMLTNIANSDAIIILREVMY